MGKRIHKNPKRGKTKRLRTYVSETEKAKREWDRAEREWEKYKRKEGLNESKRED